MADDLSPAPAPAAPAAADELPTAFSRLDRAVASNDQQAVDAAKRDIAGAWNKQLAAAGRDVAEAVNNPTLPVSPSMAEGLLRSGNAISTTHYLAKNPTEAARIARLSPSQQAVEIGRLAERVRVQRPAAPARPREETMESYLVRRNKEMAEQRRNAHKRL